jgi:hypothetical protein
MGRHGFGAGWAWAWGAIGSARGERCSAVLVLVRQQSAEDLCYNMQRQRNRQHTTVSQSLAWNTAQSADDLEEALSEVMTSLAPGTLRLHRHGISWKACDPPFTLALRVCARAPVCFVCTLFESLRACVCV